MRVVLHLEQQGAVAQLLLKLDDEVLCVDDHGPELEAAELLAVAADPGLAEQDGATVEALDLDGSQQQERAEEDEQRKRAAEVEQPLGPSRGIGRPRRSMWMREAHRLVGSGPAPRRCP